MTPTPTTAITPIEDEVRIDLVPQGLMKAEEMLKAYARSLGLNNDPRIHPPSKPYWESVKTIAEQPPAKPLKERKKLLAKKKK